MTSDHARTLDSDTSMGVPCVQFSVRAFVRCTQREQCIHGSGFTQVVVVAGSPGRTERFFCSPATNQATGVNQGRRPEHKFRRAVRHGAPVRRQGQRARPQGSGMRKHPTPHMPPPRGPPHLAARKGTAVRDGPPPSGSGSGRPSLAMPPAVTAPHTDRH